MRLADFILRESTTIVDRWETFARTCLPAAGQMDALALRDHAEQILHAIFGWPSIIAVIINYVKRSEARGTWLESHFTWQIRTFWYALLWALLVALVSIPLAFIIIGIGTWIVGMFVLGIWAIYRVARGWLALKDGRALPS